MATRPRIVLAVLLLAYAASYLCRANIEPALNVMAVTHGYDNERVGSILALALGAYALGKVLLSPLADVFGGKPVLVGVLVASALVSVTIGLLDPPARFGAGTGLLVVGGLVVVNRFVQAGGWAGLVEIVGRTFPAARRGTVMGILSTSYDIGNVVALVVSARIVGAGLGWRALFFVNPAVVFLVALVTFVFLPRRADGSGHDSSARNRDSSGDDSSVSDRPPGADGALPARPDARTILGFLGRQPAFWTAAALSFLLTFVRAGFMTWTPRFLYEISVRAGEASALSSSIGKSAFFGVAGIIGSLVTGRLTDRAGPGRRAPVMTISLALLVVAIVALGHAGISSPLVATIGVAASGLFLLGPYSLLAGAVSLDIATSSRDARGGAIVPSGTTAGVVDAIGYVGASMSAFVLGSVSKRVGWSAAFDVLALVAFLALVIGASWSIRSARRARRGRDGRHESEAALDVGGA